MDERDAEELREAHPDVARVGVVGVDQVGEPLLGAQVLDAAVDEGGKVRPEELLAQVPPRPEGEPHEAGLAGERLLGHGVVGPGRRVLDEARHEVDAGDVRGARQGPRELEDVGDLAAGVGVAAELRARPADEPVEAQVEEVEAAGHGVPRPHAERNGA